LLQSGICLKQVEEEQSLGGGMRFSNAPSWEALEDLVRARQAELGWQPADLEAVRRPPLALFQLASEGVPPLLLGLARQCPGSRPVHRGCCRRCVSDTSQANTYAAGLASRDTPSSSRLQGPTNPLALRRTFGQAGEPEVKLYRRAQHALASASRLPPRCHMRLAYERVHAKLDAGCVQRTAAHRQWGQRGRAVRDARGAC